MRFLFVDRVLQSVPGLPVIGLKHVTAEDYYLCDDGHGRACFIPSLVGETLGQLAAWHVMAQCDFAFRPVAGVAARAQFYRPVYVGETLWLEATIDALDESSVHYHGVARVGNEEVFRLEGALGPLLPMDTFIDPEVARQQWLELDRPDAGVCVLETGEILSQGARQAPSMTFDRLLSFEPLVSCVAEKRITRAASYFPDHFPRKPVLPLTVLLECAASLARVFLVRSGLGAYGVLKEARKIKMGAFVVPGDVLVGRLTVKQQNEQDVVLVFRHEVQGQRVCVLEMVMCKKAGV